jgi:hypothetical protein
VTKQMERLLVAGRQMSNICYNLKQDKGIPERHRESMKRAQEEWDEAIRQLKL